MTKDNPELICPSCMWQGDDYEYHGGECPNCQGELMAREEWDEEQAINNRDDELEERRLNNDD